MTTEKARDGKPCAGNPHVRFDKGGIRIGGNAEAWVFALLDREGNEDRNFCHIEATPPFNTVTIDLDGADARFFKIRVDNLADEVR